MQPTAVARQVLPPASVVRQPVTRLQADGLAMRCLLAEDKSLTLPRPLVGIVKSTDQIEFDPTAPDPAFELRVVQSSGRRPPELYFASIGYVTQPKTDKRNEHFVRAEIVGSRLGVKRIHLQSNSVRDYFYFPNRRRSSGEQETLFDLLRAASSTSPADLRLALRVRMIELQAEQAPKRQQQAIERAFNILANPELRSCYEALLLDPDAPVLFPYGGFGSLLVTGELSADRETFFATKILAFVPELRERRFRAPLRKIEFFDGYAVYRDSRRKAEVFLDEVSLPLPWDSTWNQWRHLISTKIGVEATFVKSGKYRVRDGEWRLVMWETAVPSRVKISLPPDTDQILADACKTYNRFGQFFDAIQSIRDRLEREPIECQELGRICGDLGIPPDFDIAQISWKPDYDSFFYNQLRKRTRKIFLFRDEYIFDLERAIVVEVPEQGHATYIFSRSDNLEQWVRDYARTPKDDVRRNRVNAAERFGFIGRVMHGRNPRTWLRNLRAKIGEQADYALAEETP